MSDLPREARLSELLDHFLTDGIGFREFYSAFMELVLPMLEGAPVPFGVREQALDDMYEWVYMGSSDPVTPGEQKDGVVGSTELKRRLAELRPAAGV
jgi:hypothetical protein